MATTHPDLRTSVPRQGRTTLGGYAWLARLADKVRAEHAGRAGDYVGYCGLSMGFLTQLGVPRDDFDRLITAGATDEDLVAYLDSTVSQDRKDAANRFVLEERRMNLDEQDAEEGYAPGG